MNVFFFFFFSTEKRIDVPVTFFTATDGIDKDEVGQTWRIPSIPNKKSYMLLHRDRRLHLP